MAKKIVSLLLAFSVSLSVFIVPVKSTFPVENTEPSEDLAYYRSDSVYWIVNVVVATDEEMRMFEPYGVGVWGCLFGTDWRSYIEYEMDGAVFLCPWRGLRHFPWGKVYFQIIAWVEWESDDSITDTGALVEQMVQATGWYHGKVYNGLKADILVGWTNQAGLSHPGSALSGEDACVVQYQIWYFDDNIVMHEVLHLYGAPDHSTPSDPSYDMDCIMSYRRVPFTAWIEEGVPLTATDCPIGYFTFNVCGVCGSIIYSNLQKYGIVFISNGGHGGGRIVKR